MTDYDSDKDLARILIEGTKAVYGKQRAVQVKTEFENLKKPNYRKNSEDLMMIVDKICRETEVQEAKVQEAKVVDSIDDAVEYTAKPSMLKVAARGTLNLVNKTCWYYPLLGMLPGKIQENLAEKYGDKAKYYTISNMAVELFSASMIGYSIANGQGAFTFGLFSFLHSSLRILGGLTKTTGVELFNPTAPIYTALPMYATLYSFLAIKAVPTAVPKVIKSVPEAMKSAGVKLKGAVEDSYLSAYKKEQQALSQSEKIKGIHPVRPIPSPPVAETQSRIETPARIEDKSEIVTEEFDEEYEESEARRLITIRNSRKPF